MAASAYVGVSSTPAPLVGERALVLVLVLVADVLAPAAAQGLQDDHVRRGVEARQLVKLGARGAERMQRPDVVPV
jgi:hypothetical protein